MAKARITPESAHVNLVRALAALQPPRIVGQVDANDIESRCEHLHASHSAIMRYLETIIGDTVNHLAATGRINQDKAALYLFDTVSGCDFDIIAALQSAGCRFANLRAVA